MNPKTVKLTVEWKSLAERVVLRFVWGFLSGALATVTLLSFADITSWTEFSSAMGQISVSIIMGGFTGGFEALKKYIQARGDYPE